MGNEKVDLVKQAKLENQPLLKRFDIPIENLSYEYIGECRNTKELERIVRILRSGEEGSYPHLTKFAEDRLSILKPESTILRVAQPIIPKKLLGPKERHEIDGEITDWMQEMKVRERDLADEREMNSERESLPRPAIRKIVGSTVNKETKNVKIEKRLSSCDYASWDKYDADTELARIELTEERERAEAKRIQEQRKIELARSMKETVIQKSLLTGTELSVMSTREREKGNEAYRAGDYEEALKLYTTSIALDCDISAYNNRAITYIKLKNYEKAVKDCNAVLDVDSMNVKALLRRASAYEYLQKYKEALRDYEFVLKVDPENKIAVSSINKLRRVDDDDSKPVRLTIEEIYDDN